MIPMLASIDFFCPYNQIRKPLNSIILNRFASPITSKLILIRLTLDLFSPIVKVYAQFWSNRNSDL